MKVIPGPNNSVMQIFPLIEGQTSKTSGTFTGISAIHCVSAGNIVIIYNTLTTETIPCVAGNDYGIINAKSVQVSTGTFHLA
jgi:hypothetical protein